MAGGFSVTISAVDQVTATMNRINAQIDKFTGDFTKQLRTANAAVERMQASFTRFGKATGLNHVTAGIRGLGRAAVYTAGKLSEVVPLVGIIGGAASVAGIERMTSRWSEWGLRISNTARQIGVGSRQLTAWQGAANLAGGSAEAMTSGMQTLGQTMFDAIGGRNGDAVTMFRTLGIAYDDGTQHARNSTQVMLELADKVAGIRDPFARAQVGVTLLGGAWQGLEPLLMLGSKRMLELEKVSREYGYVTESGIEKAKDLALAQRYVGAAVTGLGNRISEKLAPILTPMLEHFARWIYSSPVVTQGVEALGRGVAWLGDKLEHLDWDAIGKRAEEWGARLMKVLAVLQRFGIVPDFSGVVGNAAPSGPTSPTGRGFGQDGPTVPPPKAGTDGQLNPWINWGRNFAVEPNPLHWTPWYHPPTTPGSNAPNGVPRVGPTFGPQRLGNRSGATNEADPSPADRIYKPVMDFVARTESTDRGRGYNETLGYGKWTGGNVDLTKMTLDQLDRLQQSMLDKQGNNPNRSSAVGRYQFTQTTLRGMRDAFGLRGDQLYDEKMQDHLFKLRMDQRGGVNQRNVALEFASVPDPDTGQSHYGQRTGATTREVQDVLRSMHSPQAPPMQAPQPQGAPMTLNTERAGNDNNGQSTVRVEFGGRLPDGMNMRVANPQKVDVGGPLVERPALLGAMP